MLARKELYYRFLSRYDTKIEVENAAYMSGLDAYKFITLYKVYFRINFTL